MRGPGVTPSSIRCRPSRIGAGGLCSTPSDRARSMNQSMPEQSNVAGAAVTIRSREARQQFEIDLLREPAERAVGDGVARLEERHRPQVFGDQAEHLRAHVEAVERVDVEAIEDLRRRLDAHRLVIRRLDAAIDHRRRRRLAEIVADRAEHDRGEPRPIEIAVQLARLVDHHQRVDPDVALGMPLGILRAVVERLHLRQQLVDHAELAREREADRRPLAPAAAASRTRPRCARPAGRRARSMNRCGRCPDRSSARTAPRTAARAGHAANRRRTCSDRRRGGCGAARSSRP